MKFTILSLILTGFLAIPWLSYSNAQPINNSPSPTTTHLTASAAEPAGKSKICHLVNDEGFPEMFSVVIQVNDHSLDAHFAHGDCLTEAPKGSKNCTCGPEILSFGVVGCCGLSVSISWTSTGGTSAVLEHRNSVANGGGLIESLPVPTNGGVTSGSFTVGGAATCLHQFRLVITGPTGTSSQTILNDAGLGDGTCFT